MKKLVLTLVLACCQTVSLKADLRILYPVGGEKFPGNGKHNILWTNSADLGVTLYLDWYKTNGVLVTDDYVLYSAILPGGTNGFILNNPSRFPTNFLYKVRLVGTNSTVNVTSNSGFVTITGPAGLTGILTNQNHWLPGQTRNITVSWSGLQTNDTYSVILESPTLNRGDYGFLVTNLVTGSQSGTQLFTVPYPNNLPAAYPPASHSLLNGLHSFTLFNQRCEIFGTFGSIDVVTTGLRMYLAPSTASYILRGESNVCAYVTLDATLATNNVSVTNIAAIFTSYSTNTLSLKFTLKNGSQVLATNTLTFNPSTTPQYHTEVNFPMSLTVTNGQIKELTLICEVLSASGLGSFIWTTEEITSLIQSSVDATYVGGASIVKSVIFSSGSYIDVVGVVYPKFILHNTSSGMATYNVLCKPQTSYTVQWSTNFTNWSNDLTTNTVSDTFQISISVTNGNKFFRIKEN